MSAGSLWRPDSWCGPHCLPPVRRRWPAGGLRAAGRLAAVALVLAWATALAPLLAVGRPAVRSRALRLLARALLAALGVEHGLRGHPPRQTALVVANHVSWLDALVLLAHLPVRLVAKDQVRRWPLIGRLATAAGTVFIDRSRPRSLPATVAQVTAALRGGHPVAVFPEGTTWCGRAGGRFRPAMFQAAVDARTPVVPVSLRYRSPQGAPTTVASFLGDDTLIVSLLRVTTAHRLRADAHAHPALFPDAGASRRMLSRAAQASLLAWPGRSPSARGDEPGAALRWFVVRYVVSAIAVSVAVKAIPNYWRKIRKGRTSRNDPE